MPRVLCTDQRSPEWFRCRRGKITASEMTKVLAAPHTKARKNYLLQLCFDLEGVDDFHDDAAWFAFGKEFEPEAIGMYQWRTKTSVIAAGFAVHDRLDYVGASPDGLVGVDGLIEVKCRKGQDTFDAHCSKVHRLVWWQIQTQLFVWDRAWCDYINWQWKKRGELDDVHVRRVFADADAFDRIEQESVRFWWDLKKLYARRNSA